MGWVGPGITRFPVLLLLIRILPVLILLVQLLLIVVLGVSVIEAAGSCRARARRGARIETMRLLVWKGCAAARAKGCPGATDIARENV